MDIFSGAAMERIMAGIVAYEEHAAPGQMRPVRVAGHAILERFGGDGPAGTLALVLGKISDTNCNASSEDWATQGFCCVRVWELPTNMNAKAIADGAAAVPPTKSCNGMMQNIGDHVAKAWVPPGQSGRLPPNTWVPNLANGGEVLAFNPSCRVIEAGKPVIMGRDKSGNYIIIFEMCPCGD